MEDVISQRLVSLRKHLGERLNEKLSTEQVAERANLTEQQVYRLERGLNGTTLSLITLLMFYRSHGYNLDWILLLDNKAIPMILSSGAELQQIAEQINLISRGLSTGYAKLTTQLRGLGYEPLTETLDVESDTEMPEPAGLAL